MTRKPHAAQDLSAEKRLPWLGEMSAAASNPASTLEQIAEEIAAPTSSETRPRPKIIYEAYPCTDLVSRLAQVYQWSLEAVRGDQP